MLRLLGPFLAIAVLLVTVGGPTGLVRPHAAPASAQVVTPDPLPPSFDNQAGVLAISNVDVTKTTFATGQVDDPNAFPVTTVRVHNERGFAQDQQFWLSIRVRDQSPTVEVLEESDYARYGLIAPDGNATYKLRFDKNDSSRIEFELDGSTDEAIALTLIQFGVDAGLQSAGVVNLGGHDAEIGRAIAEVVLEQYVSELDTFVPCANAVAAIRQGGTDFNRRFVADAQGCLESPLWQASIPEVLSRLEQDAWFSALLKGAGIAVPELGLAMQAINAELFAAKVWGIYEKFNPRVPGAMLDRVSFIGFNTTRPEVLGAATAAPKMSVYEVVGRAQSAIQQAGTYRIERSITDEAGKRLSVLGEVDIKKGFKMQTPDGSEVQYYHSPTMYFRFPDGRWTNYDPDHGDDEPLLNFIRIPATEWSLDRTEVLDGKSAYVLERTTTDGTLTTKEQMWIDATTFLPIKQTAMLVNADTPNDLESVYLGFGEPVDVQVPDEALVPTPTPEPTPPPFTPEAIDPQELSSRLLDHPISVSELPPGYMFANVEQESSVVWAPWAIGQVRVTTVDDPTSIGDGLDFIIFATAEDAGRGYDAYQATVERQGAISSYPVVVFQYPAVQLSSVIQVPLVGTKALGIVMVQVGNVVVIGASATLPENPTQANVNAADLAAAGIQYLGGLLESPAVQEAESVVGADNDGRATLHTINGQVTLHSSSNVVGRDGGAETCKGGGGYQDIIGGATAEIAGADNKPLATTKLGLGQPSADGDTCVFKFALPEIPEMTAYSLFIAERPTVPYTLDELKGADWTVDLTLDDSML